MTNMGPCPKCHSTGHPRIGNGRVFACGKGRPPMRGARYHCRHCDPTATSPEKCEPKGVGHD